MIQKFVIRNNIFEFMKTIFILLQNIYIFVSKSFLITYWNLFLLLKIDDIVLSDKILVLVIIIVYCGSKMNWLFRIEKKFFQFWRLIISGVNHTKD